MLFPSMMLSVGTMVSALLSVSLFALIAIGTATAQGTTDLCRCTAYFEHFYDRRRRHNRNSRDLNNYVYDYSDYYIDNDGYYIVEGVRVLPDDDPACMEADDDVSTTQRVFARIFGPRHLIHELELDETNQEVNREPQRTLKVMMSRYNDDYYFNEHAVKEGMMGKGSYYEDDDNTYNTDKGETMGGMMRGMMGGMTGGMMSGKMGGMMGGMMSSYYDDDDRSCGKGKVRIIWKNVYIMRCLLIAKRITFFCISV
jgi:hypothetical protein